MNLDLGQTLLLLLILGCALPIITMVIVGFFVIRIGRRWLDETTTTDADTLYAQYAKLYQADPKADTEAIMRRLINRQAFRCGVIGAVTGLGGFITLPIALPLDMILTLRLQAATVGFIAEAYGFKADRDSAVASYLIMSTGGRVTNMGFNMAMRYIPRVIGKSLSKFLPLIGAAVSFMVNYFIAQSSGRLAMRWYAAKQIRTSTA